jgi:serine/threonine protein kinase
MSNRRKVLGTGGYGTVFEGQWRGIPVAVKRVPNNSTKEREERALLKLNHPNVIKLLGLHIDSDKHFK